MIAFRSNIKKIFSNLSVIYNYTSSAFTGNPQSFTVNDCKVGDILIIEGRGYSFTSGCKHISYDLISGDPYPSRYVFIYIQENGSFTFACYGTHGDNKVYIMQYRLS